MLENFSAVSKAAVDSCSRFQDLTCKNTERLVKQQLEMMQLTAGNSTDQVQGIKDITEIVLKNGERMAQQQLDLLKLSIDNSTEYIKESSDAEDIQSALRAQKEYAEGISSSVMGNAQSGFDLCVETQSEIRDVVKGKLHKKPKARNNIKNKTATKPRPKGESNSQKVEVKTKKSRKISGPLANRAQTKSTSK